MSKKIAVVGAGGKMGSGIALLLMSTLSKKRKKVILSFIDQNETSLIALKKYLKDQLKKEFERSIIELRMLYQDNSSLVDNEDIIRFHLESAFETVFFSTSLDEAKNSDLIFEAIFEELELKTHVLKKLSSLSDHALVLTNTSSIPIHFLEKEAGLKSRLIGFHFYNPPAVQKLVELIFPNESRQDLMATCHEMAQGLGKTTVISKDVAGFIGNGVFIREILFTLRLLKKMDMTIPEAIFTLDLITKTFLFRPMGIFQLLDYVGIDVAVNILSIMSKFLDDPSIDSNLLKQMLALGKKGGPQGDGFFSYHSGVQISVFDPEKNMYIPIENIQDKCLEFIGTSIDKAPSWKTLSKEKDPGKKIEEFYASFFKENTLAVEIALKYLYFEKDIAFLLVKTDVAKSIQDVTSVLKLGFYHLFGPDAKFIPAACDRCIQ